MSARDRLEANSKRHETNTDIDVSSKGPVTSNGRHSRPDSLIHLRRAGKPAAPKSKHQARKQGVDNVHGTQTGMPLGIPRGARCVQRFDDSLNSAIHITYRISLRSSSMREPRDPLLKVVLVTFVKHSGHVKGVYEKVEGRLAPERADSKAGKPYEHVMPPKCARVCV